MWTLLTFVARGHPGIGDIAGSASGSGVGADTDDARRFRWEHARVKAAHARALTLGASAAWVLPIALVCYAGVQESTRHGWAVAVACAVSTAMLKPSSRAITARHSASCR